MNWYKNATISKTVRQDRHGIKMKKYTINKGFIVQKLGKKTVIFDGEKSLLYTFNETATLIFDKLKRNINSQKIAEELGSKYNITVNKALTDVTELETDLIDKKIISAEKQLSAYIVPEGSVTQKLML